MRFLSLLLLCAYATGANACSSDKDCDHRCVNPGASGSCVTWAADTISEWSGQDAGIYKVSSDYAYSSTVYVQNGDGLHLYGEPFRFTKVTTDYNNPFSIFSKGMTLRWLNVHNTYSFGGKDNIKASGSGYDIKILNCLFERLDSNGAATFPASLTDTPSGCLYIQGVINLDIYKSVFKDWKSTYSGAVINTLGTATIQESTFKGSSGQPAIRATGAVTIRESNFVSNANGDITTTSDLNIVNTKISGVSGSPTSGTCGTLGCTVAPYTGACTERASNKGLLCNDADGTVIGESDLPIINCDHNTQYISNEECVYYSTSCNAGYFLGSGSATTDKCEACPSGQYQDSNSYTGSTCSEYSTSCNAGYFLGSGSATTDKCEACPSGYHTTTATATACVINQCTCANGTPDTGADCNADGSTEKCASCNTGYHLDANNACVANQCICTNGVAVADGAACPAPGDEWNGTEWVPVMGSEMVVNGMDWCASCNEGYVLHYDEDIGNVCSEFMCEIRLGLGLDYWTTRNLLTEAYTGNVGEYEVEYDNEPVMVGIPFEGKYYTLSQLSYLSSTSGNLQCANGYHGTPNLTICTEDPRDSSITPTDTQYTLTGCEPNVCVCEDDNGNTVGVGNTGSPCYAHGASSCLSCKLGHHEIEIAIDGGGIYDKCLPNQCYCDGGDGRLTNGDNICYAHFENEYVWFQENYEWEDYGPHNPLDAHVFANGGNRNCTSCTATGSVMIDGDGTNGGGSGEKLCVCNAAAGFVTNCAEPRADTYFANTCIPDGGNDYPWGYYENEYQVNDQTALQCICDPAAHLVSDILGGCVCASGYHLEGDACVINQCVCTNGQKVADGAACPAQGDEECASCNDNSFLYSGNECNEIECLDGSSEYGDETDSSSWYAGYVGEYNPEEDRRRLALAYTNYQPRNHVKQTLSQLTYLNSTLQCANGYHGTPSMTMCTKDPREFGGVDYGLPNTTFYTLTGCEPNVCVCEDDNGATMGLGYSGEEFCREHGGNSCSGCKEGYDTRDTYDENGDYLYTRCLPNQCYCNGGVGVTTDGDNICYEHFEANASPARRLSTKSSRAKSSRLKSRRLDGEYVWFQENYEWYDYGPHNPNEDYVVANGGNRQCASCIAGAVLIDGDGTNGGGPGEKFCACNAAAGFVTNCAEPLADTYFANTCIEDGGNGGMRRLEEDYYYNEYQVNAQTTLQCICDPAAHLVSDILGGCVCNLHDGYISDNGACRLKECTCEYGAGATGAACDTDGTAQCASTGCNAGYHFNGCDGCEDTCDIAPVCSDTTASNYNPDGLGTAVLATAPIDNSLCEYDLGVDVTIEEDIDLTNPDKKPSIKDKGGDNPKNFRKQYVRELFRRKASGGPTKFTMDVADMVMDGFKRTYAADKKVKMIEPRRIEAGQTIADIAEETISTELKDEPVYAPLLEGEAVKLKLATKGNLVVKLHQTDASTLQVTIGDGGAVDITEGASHVEQGISVSYGSGIVEDDVLCSAPASTTGYSDAPENITNSAIPDYMAATPVTCADGYYGTAVLGECTDADPTYVLSGCSIKVCTCEGGTPVADGVDCTTHNTTQCQDCDAASQYINGSNACVNDTETSCSAGEGFSDGGSTGDSSCTACEGIQWSDGMDACQNYTVGVKQDCYSGYKTFIDGNHEADHACSALTCGEQGFGDGSSASLGSAECDGCIQGYGGNDTLTGCVECDQYTYNNVTDSPFTQECADRACGLGYGVTSNTGANAPDGDYSCEECPEGQYSDDPATGECQIIPVGHGCTDASYNGTGCTAIEECRGDQHVVNFVCVDDSISGCPDGQEFIIGTSNTTDDGKCQECTGNQYSTNGDLCAADSKSVASDCAIGKAFIVGTNNTLDDGSCRTCDGNEQSSEPGVCTFDSVSIASDCAIGEQFTVGTNNTLDDGSCRTCDGNEQSSEPGVCEPDSVKATDCLENQFFTAGTNNTDDDGTCTACGAHEHSTGGAACSRDSCVAPADTTGYANVQTGQWDSLSAECAGTHDGTAVVTPCASDGGEFTLSGCTSKVLCDGTTARSPVTGVGCWCGSESTITAAGKYCIHGNTQTKPLCPLSSSAATADCRCYTPDTSLASECLSGQFCDSGGCLTEMNVETMRLVDPSTDVVQSDWDTKAEECSASEFVHLQQDNTLVCAACSRATFRSTYAMNNILDAQGADTVPDRYKHYKCCINPAQAVCQAMKDAYISRCKQDGVCAAESSPTTELLPTPASTTAASTTAAPTTTPASTTAASTTAAPEKQ